MKLFLTIQTTKQFLDNANLVTIVGGWKCQIEDLHLTARSTATHIQTQPHETTESKGRGDRCWSPLPIFHEAQLSFLSYLQSFSRCISHTSASVQVQTHTYFLIAKKTAAFSCKVHHVVSSQRRRCPIVFNQQDSILDQ